MSVVGSALAFVGIIQQIPGAQLLADSYICIAVCPVNFPIPPFRIGKVSLAGGSTKRANLICADLPHRKHFFSTAASRQRACRLELRKSEPARPLIARAASQFRLQQGASGAALPFKAANPGIILFSPRIFSSQEFLTMALVASSVLNYSPSAGEPRGEPGNSRCGDGGRDTGQVLTSRHGTADSDGQPADNGLASIVNLAAGANVPSLRAWTAKSETGFSVA